VQVRVSDWSLSFLPSPIPELQHALYPSIVLQARERAPIPCFSVVFSLGLTFESLKELGERHLWFSITVVLFLNLVSCFELGWMMWLHSNCGFWVIDVSGFEFIIYFESKWMDMVVFGFEQIMGAILFLVLNQNVWMWGLMQCNCSLDIWILSLVDLASLCCWIVVGCTWILGMCMHLFLGHMDFEFVRLC
jgi:hypothetical protein